jgi:hypothetical protein
MSKLVQAADQQTIAWLGSRRFTGLRANKMNADGRYMINHWLVTYGLIYLWFAMYLTMLSVAQIVCRWMVGWIENNTLERPWLNLRYAHCHETFLKKLTKSLVPKCPPRYPKYEYEGGVLPADRSVGWVGSQAGDMLTVGQIRMYLKTTTIPPVILCVTLVSLSACAVWCVWNEMLKSLFGPLENW